MAHFLRQLTTFFLKHLPHLVAVAILSFAVYFLWNDFATLDWHKAFAQIHSLAPAALVLALLFTVLNFTVLTFYDVLALRYLGYKLPYRKMALTAFIAHAFSGNLGVAMLTGGAVRYRFYTRWGVLAVHIAHLLVFSTITLGLGLFALGGVLLLFTTSGTLPFLPAVRGEWLDLIGLGLLAVVATYLVLCRIYHKPITFKGITFSLPSLKLSLGQIGIGTLDWMIAGSVFYILLLGSTTAVTFSLHTFFLAFIIAQLAAINSHVPGGLGVFDGLMLLMLKPTFPVEEILAIIVVYRFLYYLLPFLVALTLFGLFELRLLLKNAQALKKAP